MPIKPLLLSLIVLTLSACSVQKKQEYAYFDFADSVTIIRNLLQSDSLAVILEDADPEGLETLVNNFSPAQIAFESEVLNCTLPVLIYFYCDELSDSPMLDALAQEYSDRLKIVIIDIQKFFTIAESFEINQVPTSVFMRNRNEYSRIVGCLDKNKCNTLLTFG